jgi:hypothetical protein
MLLDMPWAGVIGLLVDIVVVETKTAQDGMWASSWGAELERDSRCSYGRYAISCFYRQETDGQTMRTVAEQTEVDVATTDCELSEGDSRFSSNDVGGGSPSSSLLNSSHAAVHN